MEVITKLIWLDSMAKVFHDEEPVESIEGVCPSFFVNEVFSVQLAIKSTDESDNDLVEIEVDGPLAPFIRLREVVAVPVRYAGKERHGGEYLS